MSKYFGILVAILAVFVLVASVWPLPDSAERIDSQDGATPEARTNMLFESIAASNNLQRPFPEMMTRADNPASDAKIELGRLLYFDPVLSGANDMSCAHCHHPDLGFSDNRGLSMGVGGKGLGRTRKDGKILKRGSPTIWNAAYNHRQFWDGRAVDLEDQARSPITAADEMAQDSTELVQELAAIPTYKKHFKRAFPDAGANAITFRNVRFAIAAFERSLLSQNSRFDRYASGELAALSPAERRGLGLFRSLKTRCFECHNLPTFANPDFKVIGVPDADGMPADSGRGEFAGPAYKFAFKVPTLRNIALTAPYMHNGRFQTLAEVLDFYAQGGGPGAGFHPPNLDDKIRKFKLSGEERADMIAFLHALTDESLKPKTPAKVPSGLAPVKPLKNQSPELAARGKKPKKYKPPKVRRQGKKIIITAKRKIQDGLDAAQPGDTVLVYPGVYHESLTLDHSGITLLGVKTDDAQPILDGRNVLSDGLIGSASDFEIRNFTVRNYTANALMISGGERVVFRDLKCENPGLYGVYPVECIDVLVERCEVTGARDAGIYVGQSRDIVVQDCRAYANVTGIEIENSINALVYNNDVYNNTGGVLVFLLPNNPSKVSRDCRVHSNRIYANNHPNFADPTAIVSKVPPGTGVMLLAADDVEVKDNAIRENNTVGIAVVHLDMVFDNKSKYDVDPAPDGNRIFDNLMFNNGNNPAPEILEMGLEGKDLIWDLTGKNNTWQQPEASSIPPLLPKTDWPDFANGATQRFWHVLLQLAG